jgi:hypothetical protein
LEIQRIATAALAAVIFGSATGMMMNAFRRRLSYTDPEMRIECLYASGPEAKINAGELEPFFWDGFFADLPDSLLESVDLAFGPRLILHQPDFKFLTEKYLRPGKVPGALDTDWLMCHSALRWLLEDEHSVKLRLYLKLQQPEKEQHYSVGSNGTIFLEKPHGKRAPGGGEILMGYRRLRKNLLRTYRGMVEDEKCCVLLTAQNAYLFFSKIKFEPENKDANAN